MSRNNDVYRDCDKQPEEQLEIRNLECRVCNESYLLDADRVPRLLDCGHTVCQICVQRLFALSINININDALSEAENTHDSSRVIHCPFCRSPMRIANVTHLRRNYAFSDLIESEREQRAANASANASGKLRKQNLRQSEGDAVGPLSTQGSTTQSGTTSSTWQTDTVEREVRCDEDDAHSADQYCTVCRTHLCAECAARTHATRTLQRHKRVPLSEKASSVYFDYVRCVLHASHTLELVCVEPGCTAPLAIGPYGGVCCDLADSNCGVSSRFQHNGSPSVLVRFACYACIETGPHRGHAYRTVEDEAATIRRAVRDAQRGLRTLLGEIGELGRQIRATQLRIGGESARYDSAITDRDGSVGGDTILGENGSAESRGTLIPSEQTYAVSADAVGTAEQTRSIITGYFQAQYRRLKQQEDEALITLGSHIRERLSKLTMQRNELERIMAEVQAVYNKSERFICQHNARVCVAKAEISVLLHDCNTLRRAFTERADRAYTTRLLDPRIPITFTKDNQLHIGMRIEIRVCILGLDGAGKTSIMHRLKQNEFIPGVAPTIGFNVETIEYANAFRAVHASSLFSGGVQYRAVSASHMRSSSDTESIGVQQGDALSTINAAVSPNRAVASNVCFTLWDMSGMHKVRALWKYYYANTHAIIYVVDSADRARLRESAAELHRLMLEPSLRSTALLIMANKQDLLHATAADIPLEQSNGDAAHWSVEELIAEMSLYNLVSTQRSWRVQPCSALTGLGVADALEWIALQFVVTEANNDPRAHDGPSASRSAMAAVEDQPMNVTSAAQRSASQSQLQSQSQSPLEITVVAEQRNLLFDTVTATLPSRSLPLLPDTDEPR